MKKLTITVCICLLAIAAFAQPAAGTYEYTGRTNPAVKQENLSFIRTIGEIMPGLFDKMGLPWADRELLDQLLHQRNMFFEDLMHTRGMASANHYCNDNRHNDIIEILGAEVTCTNNDSSFTGITHSDTLTPQIKNMLNSIMPGTDVYLLIKLRFKNQPYNARVEKDKITYGALLITVVPHAEAGYPGGFKKMTQYFIENVVNKIPGANAYEKIQMGTVKFTVNEQGHTQNAEMLYSTGDKGIDKLIINAVYNMPAWKPAENSEGVKVKQVFTIPLGSGGC